MMILTDEQKAIVNSIYDTEKVIKIEAMAGSGKTSVMLEVAKEIRKKDKDCKILYLVFNKSMVLDSKIKFDALDLNVECNTIHSFALRRYGMIKDIKMDIKPSPDFASFMKIKNSDKFKKVWVAYKDVFELFNAYCLTYDNMNTFCSDAFNSPDKYGFKSKISRNAIDLFKQLYELMIKNNQYTHGMYLKEYSCNCADAPKYKYLILDEAQDISIMSINIIKRIKCDKMFAVGDSKQNIYSFMKTVNMFDKFDGKNYTLSKSFRFNDEICAVANDILSLGYPDYKKDSVKNSHNITKLPSTFSKTILFRLNATLFEYAVNLISELDNVKVRFMDIVNGNKCEDFEEVFSDLIYFYYKLIESKSKDLSVEFRNNFRVSNFNKEVDQYIKQSEKEGSSFYYYMIKNKIILPLNMQKYLNFFMLNETKIIEVLDNVRKSQNIVNPAREFILVCSHSAKGLEWDWVKIANDKWSMSSKDEINLLYVAVTRARYALDYDAIKPLLEEKRQYAR